MEGFKKEYRIPKLTGEYKSYPSTENRTPKLPPGENKSYPLTGQPARDISTRSPLQPTRNEPVTAINLIRQTTPGLNTEDIDTKRNVRKNATRRPASQHHHYDDRRKIAQQQPETDRRRKQTDLDPRADQAEAALLRFTLSPPITA